MNQKYLQGISSNMESVDDAVFFEATAENISAFLFQHGRAIMSAIGTTNEITFLTARMGIIDVCPDQEFLVKELLPIYAKIQMGELPAPPLKTVPKKVACAKKCPRPDWNYLRWDGYSDAKYRGIINGSALLKLPHYGKKVPLELQVRSYYSGGNLALRLVAWSGEYPEPWGELTTKLGYSVEKDCAFVDVNDMGESILPWIEKNGLGTPTGRTQRSGFVTYPEYRFNAERLRAWDDYGYQEYSNRYDREHGGVPDACKSDEIER